MKQRTMTDLESRHSSLGKSLKRVIRKPRKTAPAQETLRGWAKSSIRSRNKI